jgi:hypothetical protein
MKLVRRATWACITIVLIALACLSAWHGGRASWGDASALSARWLVTEWREGRGPAFSPELWQDTKSQLVEALQITPGNAQIYDDLGFLHAARAQALGTTETGGILQGYQFRLLDEDIVNYRAAAALRPTFPYSWAYLALAKQLRGQRDDELWLSFDRAMRYGATEVAVRWVLAQIAYEQWNTLDSVRKAKVAMMVKQAPQGPRGKLLALAQEHGIKFEGIPEN